MRRWSTLGLAVCLCLAMVTEGRPLGDPPPYSPDIMDQLCAPDPTFNLKEGEIVVPILIYHFVGRSVLEKDGRSVSRFNVTAADFEAQLALLQQLGYHTVTVGEIAAALNGTGTLPERPIALTFDDGWREQYEVAFPLLQKYGRRATFFVVTTHIGYSRFMGWEELTEMRDAGMEIASHGRKHINLADADDKDAWLEITLSREKLEEESGIAVVSFAYPFGEYRRGLPAMLERAGYQVAVGIGWSVVHKPAGRYYIRRIEVNGQGTLPTFLKSLPWRGEGTSLCAPSEKNASQRSRNIPPRLNGR